MSRFKDWQIRAIKTFIQSFGGIAIPEICLILSGNLPTSFKGWVAVIIPILCASLAAGISSAWNIINEKLKKDISQDI